MRKLISYMLNGLIISLPLVVLVYIFWQLFIFLDQIIPIDDKKPGLGLLVLLLVLIAIGFLGNTLIAAPIKTSFARFLKRFPLLKTIYSAISDLMSAFVGKKKSFKKAVLVDFSQAEGMQKIGFITDEELEVLNGDFENKVAVYFPHAYSYTGDLFLVDKSKIHPIDSPPSDVMKYIISGGVSEIKKDDE